MWGSEIFRIVSGSREQIGYVYLDLPVPEGGVIPKGTWIDYGEDADGKDTDLTGALASGFGIGFLTQDIDEEGLAGLQGFQNFIIQKYDNPAKNGSHVAIAKPSLGAELQFEGKGNAVPGNLVCTQGTGAISSATPRLTKLSTLNGCIRIAQSGDTVQFILLKADLDPIADDSNVRIQVQYVGNAGAVA